MVWMKTKQTETFGDETGRSVKNTTLPPAKVLPDFTRDKIANCRINDNAPSFNSTIVSIHLRNVGPYFRRAIRQAKVEINKSEWQDHYREITQNELVSWCLEHGIERLISLPELHKLRRLNSEIDKLDDYTITTWHMTSKIGLDRAYGRDSWQGKTTDHIKGMHSSLAEDLCLPVGLVMQLSVLSVLIEIPTGYINSRYRKDFFLILQDFVLWVAKRLKQGQQLLENGEIEEEPLDKKYTWNDVLAVSDDGS